MAKMVLKLTVVFDVAYGRSVCVFVNLRLRTFNQALLVALTRVNHSERANGLNEWLRFIDGFILFNDLEFRFMKKNEGEPNLSLFRFEEKEGEDGYWIFNDGYIEDDGEYGEGEYIQFELIRKGDSFLCVSREFVPDPPLPPK